MSQPDNQNNRSRRALRGDGIQPQDVIAGFTHNQLIEEARARRENRDVPFEERKRRADLRRAQAKAEAPALEIAPEVSDEVMPTSEEIRAHVEAWKISEAMREAEIANIAYDAASAAMMRGSAAPAAGLLAAVTLHGKTYVLAPSDALSLVGALAMAVDGETARITLASGDVLELTHQDVSDIGRQLAGKPADEVSG